MTIHGAPTSDWQRAIDQVRLRVNDGQDLDRCASLLLEPLGTAMSVRVDTSASRSATRHIGNPQMLVRTVEALLVLPPPVVGSHGDISDPKELPGEQDEIVQPVAAPSSVRAAHLEVGLGAGGRLGGSPTYGSGGISGFANLALDHWVLGIGAKWDMVQDLVTMASPSGFNMQTFGVGVALGRRFELGQFNVDAMLGPEVTVESQEAEGAADGLGGTASDVRVDLALRASVPRTGKTRFFAAGDADASPSRLRRTKQLDPGLPELPAWSSGIHIGIMWGSL
jgi:hypothetical protein